MFVTREACFIEYVHFPVSVVSFVDQHHSSSVVVTIASPDGSMINAQRCIYRKHIPVPRSIQLVSTGRLVHKWLFTLPIRTFQSYYRVDVKFEQALCTVVS